MASLFNITQDESINWITRKTEHIDYAAIDHPNIVADITAILQENDLVRVSDVAAFAPDVSGFAANNIWSWGPFKTISTGFWTIIYMIGAAIAITMLYKCYQCCIICGACFSYPAPKPTPV